MAQSFFDLKKEESLTSSAPLAERMRPENLSEFVGQEHIIAKGKMLYRLIEADKLSSIILYGPPGSGKTTLARIVANTTRSDFIQINAVTSGVGDIKEIIKKASDNLGMYSKRTIVFIDEIHRFNKAQQDALLPSVENGTIIMIGATTENPYFEINPALISRSTLFELKRLNAGDIRKIITNTLRDPEKGLGKFRIELSDEAMNHWANVANGDSRTAINALELAFLTTPPDEDGVIRIDLATAEECIQKRSISYDKSDSGHYDTISAFIKSMRGSDPNAALYYMAKMLYCGEDPKFIARRMVIFASEDISNADPHALQVALDVFRAVEVIGLPECRINLAQGATYLACAPKSNASYVALSRAMGDIKKYPTADIPLHLRNAVYEGQKADGVGIGYKYPHDFPGHYVPQQYMPAGFEGRMYYEPTEQGYEKTLKEYLEMIKNEYNK